MSENVKEILRTVLSSKTDDLANKADDADVSNKADDADGQAKDGDDVTVRQQADADAASKEGGGDAYSQGEDEMILSGKRPALPEHPVIDENGNLTDYGRWYYERPAWKNKTIEDVWSSAQDADARVYDRQSKQEITWDRSKPRGEQWQMGHKPGYEFSKHQQSAAERGIEIKQFREEYNTSAHVEPELPKSNMSHKGEAPKGIYYGF